MSLDRSEPSTKRYSDLINAIPFDHLVGLADAIRVIDQRANTLYVAGNGGSCANAAHLVLHLRELGFRGVDLTADSACITAIANDHSYTEVFGRLLKAQAIDGDGLLVISGSGKSPNIINALQAAREQYERLTTLGLLGFGGGDAAQLCDVAVIMDSCEYGPVEVAHDACIHLIAELLSRTLTVK